MNGANVEPTCANHVRKTITYTTLLANQKTIFLSQMKKGEEATSSKASGRVNKLFGDRQVNISMSVTKSARLNLIEFQVE